MSQHAWWQVEENQDRWTTYLRTTDTYGTYHDRLPEYVVVADRLLKAGLRLDDLLVDVGAGWCDLDHALRTQFLWRGRYFPVDGAVQGIDLNHWAPTFPADWHVSIETIEHVREPERLCLAMLTASRKGVVVTTPNADVVDVLAVDPTHVTPVTGDDLKRWGFEVTTATLNPGRGDGDTLVGVWAKAG